MCDLNSILTISVFLLMVILELTSVINHWFITVEKIHFEKAVVFCFFLTERNN